MKTIKTILVISIFTITTVNAGNWWKKLKKLFFVAHVSATTLLVEARIKEINGYEIHDDIDQAINEGKKTYTVRGCYDEEGQFRAVPSSFINCPFNNNNIEYRVLDLSK